MLRSSAGSMDRSIERSKSSRSVDRQVNMIVSGAETLMNQYEYYLAQRTVVAKALEIAQTAQAIQQTMQARGLRWMQTCFRPQPSCPRQNPSWRV